MKYVVVAREDRQPDGSKGPYTICSRRIFATRREAEVYASHVSPSREPIVVGRVESILEVSRSHVAGQPALSDVKAADSGDRSSARYERGQQLGIDVCFTQAWAHYLMGDMERFEKRLKMAFYTAELEWPEER